MVVDSAPRVRPVAPPQDNGRVLLYVLHCGNLFGTERMALATLSGLTEYRERIVLAPPPADQAVSVLQEARRAGYTTIEYVGRGQLFNALRARFRAHRKIDVIGTGPSEALFGSLLANTLFVDLRQIQVVHGGYDSATYYRRKRWLRHVSTRVVAVSKFIRDKLIMHGVRTEDISVVPNFLADANDRPKRGPRRQQDGAERIHVALVSRVDPIKKVGLLVESVETGRLDRFDFHVYGTGVALEELSRRSEALENVTFHGYCADVATRLALADTFLHLCPDEPFGLVVLEAFAARVLCVVPDRGGAGDLVEDGITGLRFTADDRDSLIEILTRSASISAAAIDQIVSNAETRLQSEYSPERGFDRYRDVFHTCRAIETTL